MAGLLGMPQQNWLDRGLANPMTHLGMGLLSANQPRMSTNLSDFQGMGVGPGLLQGVGSYNAYQGSQAKRAALEAKYGFDKPVFPDQYGIFGNG